MNEMKRRLFAGVLGICTLLPYASSAEATSALGELSGHIPAVGVSDLEQEISRAAAAGARYLLQLPDQDPKGHLFVPPYRVGAPVEVVEEERRYRRVMRTIPVYEYENYTVMQPDEYGVMKAVNRQRPVKQIGTRDEEYLVFDPEGDVVQIHRHVGKRKADEFQGPDIYRDGVIGQNGLTLYALLSAGVPADMAPVPSVIADLMEFTDYYGLPDRTWDLAWLAAGLCRFPDGDGRIDRLRTRIANKLLLGQIPSGPGQGLWGPYASSPEVVAAMVRTERKHFLEDIMELSQELRRDPDDKAKNRKLGELKKAHRIFTDQYKDYDLGLRFHAAHRPLDQASVDIRPDPDDPDRTIRIISTPYHAFGERLGDLESTRTALFALRLLEERGNLPALTSMPKDEKGGDLIPPKRPAVIIEQGLRAVAACRDRSGGYHEGNVMQTVSEFNDLGYVGLPVDPGSLPELPSPVTEESMVNAYAALKTGAGFTGVRSPNSRVGNIAAYLDREIPKVLNTKARPHTDEYIEPFSLILDMTGVEAPSEKVGRLLLRHVLAVQDPSNGCWSVKLENRGWRKGASSSLEAFFDKARDRWYALWKRNNPEKFAEITEADQNKALNNYWQIFGRDLQPDVYCTAAALSLFSETLQSPGIGFWQRDESSVPAGRVLNRVLAEFNQRRGGGPALGGSVFEEDLGGLSSGVPLLVAGGRGDFAPGEEALRRFGDYLAGGGFVIGIADAGEAGIAFADSLEKAVLETLPASTAKRFSLAGGQAEVDAVLREDGSAAAVLFVVGNAPDPASKRPVIPVGGMMSAMLDIIRLRLGPEQMADKRLVDLTRLTALGVE